MIYSFSPFGYEGSLVAVEVDLRRGIPAVDIVGLADGSVKGSRERMISAIRNSGFEFPSERVLISLSPADLRKEGASFDLPLALAVLSEKDDYPRSQDAKVMVMGELELSGNTKPVRAIYPALSTAVSAGIKYAIIPKGCETTIPKGIHVTYVENLREAYDALVSFDEYDAIGNGEFDESTTEETTEMKVEFNDIPEDNLDSIEGHNGLKYSMAVAVAGRHHLLAYGAPGCGKTMVLQHLPELMPKLFPVESMSVTRIHSIAGLLKPNEGFKKIRPFRMPHQTASIEGICGGGPSCRPGEISLAHNGVLFLDEAAEFRSSVLQMLRVPLECNSITLSRAGRTTVYPARFQLIMATNPCPCGNYGSKGKFCLDSVKSIEMYWRKFSAPLLDRIAIRFDAENEEGFSKWSLETLRSKIKLAWERQYKRQGKLNQDLTEQEVVQLKVCEDAKEYFDKISLGNDLSQRAKTNLLKLARTIADMNDFPAYDETKSIEKRDIVTAFQLRNLPDFAESI